MGSPGARETSVPQLSCAGVQAPLLWLPPGLHNSVCGPLLPVPTPALEAVQLQMERNWGPAEQAGLWFRGEETALINGVWSGSGRTA